jgi:uncharacterized protein (TIGR03437 family)
MGFAQAISPSGTVNSADYSRNFAPGAIVSIFGTGLASQTGGATSLPLPTAINGTSVTIGASGELCPLFYVSATQINAQLPFDLPVGPAKIQVTTAAGTSGADTITIAAAAPKFFTVDFSGSGSAIVTDANFNVISSANPLKPGSMATLFMNSLGPTTGNPVAGQGAPGATPGSDPAALINKPTVTVSGISAPVSYAGLTPGSTGLYQINIQVPFVQITGPVPIIVISNGIVSQFNVSLPYQQLGFYWSLLGGQAVSGQTLNGVSGATSALAFEQSDGVTWGNTGYQAWTNNTGLGSNYSVVSGLALTLFNGTSIVYDNNGIETGKYGTFYNNLGGGPNSQKPGLTDLYSMSNYFPLIFAGYFKLAQATTVTQLVGYFDVNGSTALPFDPTNPYVKYRMNIWTNASGLPAQSSNLYSGNTFSSDTTGGTFAYSDTNVKIVSSSAGDATKQIFRLSYTLNKPLSLPAGEYWFSHDASVRGVPAVSSTANFMRVHDLADYISSHVVEPVTGHFNLFGRDMFMTNSWSLPDAYTILPSTPVEWH